MEYLVNSKWSGWFGGWGSEDDISDILDNAAEDGWRLIRTESIRQFWWWVFPRPKLLLIFERPKV